MEAHNETEDNLPDQYKRVRDFLQDEDFYSGSKECIETLFRLVTRMNDWDANVGNKYTRTQHNEREKAFYEEWMKWNEPLAGVNNGNGILQDLFIKTGPGMFGKEWILEVSHRERMIVATIIQWLGTNVGFSFLQQALARCGYTVKWPEKPLISKTDNHGQ